MASVHSSVGIQSMCDLYLPCKHSHYVCLFYNCIRSYFMAGNQSFHTLILFFQADTLTVECKSKQCPELDCATELQIRPDALACCKVLTLFNHTQDICNDEKCSNVIKQHSVLKTCTVFGSVQICKDPPPTPETDVQDPNNLADRPQIRTDEDVLNAGGCKWREQVLENGARWNPSVLPYGEISCVSCKCKVQRLLIVPSKAVLLAFVNQIKYTILYKPPIILCHTHFRMVWLNVQGRFVQH